MSNKSSRARELLEGFSSFTDDEIELPASDREALKVVVRYINGWCTPPLAPGELVFDDDAYFFFTMGRAFERLAPGSPGTVQVAA